MVCVPQARLVLLRERRSSLLHEPDLEVVGRQQRLGHRQDLDHKSCTPSYKCGYTSRWVGVYLSVPKYHGAARYYGKMSVELSVSGKMKWEAGYFTAPKGVTAYWKFPLVWPYL